VLGYDLKEGKESGKERKRKEKKEKKETEEREKGPISNSSFLINSSLHSSSYFL
jgi:hypothetical protein